MDDLRLILISVGALVLLGIYLWGVLRKRQGSLYRRLHEVNPDGLDDLPVTRQVPVAEDEAAADNGPETLSNDSGRDCCGTAARAGAGHRSGKDLRQRRQGNPAAIVHHGQGT